MSGPISSQLGPDRLELGPARDAQRDRHWRAATDTGGVCWLLLDVEGQDTNTINEDVLRGLSDQLGLIEADPPSGLVIRSAKPGGFAAGADVGMLAAMTDPKGAGQRLRDAHAILDRLEDLPCPTVAVVHGAALGAGFEIVLACDACIAIDGASFGFPEIKLGLHPGLGGTFRLPARINDTKAMKMMLTGRSAHTSKAKDLGIADVVTQERHLAAAVRGVLADGIKRNGPGLADRAMAIAPARSIVARRMRAKTQDKAPQEHYPAPFKLIDLWEQHVGGREAQEEAEIDSFVDLLETDTARNLMRLFRLRQKLKSRAPDEDGVEHVHVIGAGQMGGAIAAWCAMKGKTVTLSDPDLQQIGKALPAAVKLCEGAHLSSLETRDALDRLIPDPDGEGASHADLVIEAGPEDAGIKAEIYAKVEPRLKPDAILATNTSSLGLEGLAHDLRRPGQFAGLHFFNPVEKLPLVEVVSADKTEVRVQDALAAFCGAVDKLPARVSDGPGYLVNRALTPYLLEAVLLIGEGIQNEAIDLTATRFGMPTGPVELADRIGLDICLDVADSLRSQLDKPMAEIPDWFRDKVRQERHTGRKAQRGFYLWKDGNVQKIDSNNEPKEDFTDRLILPMLNACVECLRKGVAEDEDQVDAALVFGAGFAPFRGGPMRYARSRGALSVRDRLEELADIHGERFRPDPGWSDLA
ncbi:3-hydroxyacyl-CoA dehydrogenase NAD-binding domain-containing protein [Defluviimonas sp. WL0002]|uniref:enoyl-CoA hydratase n=1 Tax=Albidovulum marisflavi TaxID=2984159 RepID=A0ABT2ZD94_9RHOB|nr:3-hydroxyacyl-CoA dehydrogenase NAD-binding domain-containing protein [Defluviimonas sp. WL0002]MCV2869115.1 3-hydroxyacyl-CoA dehydrogenase NAD-binding domain-containing protein [Defluviimonas sp. WL0002]